MPSLLLQPVQPGDAESLAALRVEAMRESLERAGRFDPERARRRFLDHFAPEHTRAIVQGAQRVGFVVVCPHPGQWLLDHLYVLPSHQGRGIGGKVLRMVIDEAEAARVKLRVGALKASGSNRFYQRHGFELVEEAEFDNYYVRQPTMFPPSVPQLAGARLRLRELDESDIAPWFERASDAESADLAGDPLATSIEQGAAWLERHREKFRQRKSIRWAIVPHGAAASIGTVGLVFNPEEAGTSEPGVAIGELGVAIGELGVAIAELGVAIARRHWAQGFATEAVQLVAHYAFATLGVSEIRAEVLQRNVASIRLLERTGFTRVGELRSAAETGGEAEDCYLYALRNS